MRTEYFSVYIIWEQALDMAGVKALRRGVPVEDVAAIQGHGSDMLSKWLHYQMGDTDLHLGVADLCEQLDQLTHDLAVCQHDSDMQVAVVVGS